MMLRLLYWFMYNMGIISWVINKKSTKRTVSSNYVTYENIENLENLYYVVKYTMNPNLKIMVCTQWSSTEFNHTLDLPMFKKAQVFNNVDDFMNQVHEWLEEYDDRLLNEGWKLQSYRVNTYKTN